METISLLFNQANVLPTLAMLAIVAYWLLMIVGVVGMDTLDFDVDVDPGLDIDLDPGLDLDLDPGLDVGGDLDVGADVGVDVAPDIEVEAGGNVLDAGRR